MMVLLLALSASVASGQPRLAPLATMFELSLALGDDQPLYPRTPVPFRVDVRNLTSTKTGVGLVLVPFDDRYARVLYRKLPEPFQAMIYGPDWKDSIDRDPQSETFFLEPNGTEAFYLALATDPGRAAFLFGEPGDYEIRIECHAKWRSPDDVLATAPLRFRVEPAPPSEAAALADWDVELATFAQDDGGSGGPHYRREVPRALKFMDKHPMSLYSRLLRQRTFDSLHRMRREGQSLSEYEKEAFERLKVSMREEAQHEAQQR
jgi:hypothetical protein